MAAALLLLCGLHLMPPPAAAQGDCETRLQRQLQRCASNARNAAIQTAGPAALTCVTLIFLFNAIGFVTCMFTIGVSLWVAWDIVDSYEWCREIAFEMFDMCVEINCT